MPRDVQDTRQTLYSAHNRDRHCGCPSCQALRRDMPRLAATLDGEAETARRAKQYRAGDVA